jgi:hypothetical protein
MFVALQVVGADAVPLKVAVLVPWVAPKFAPLIVIRVPTSPEAGVRLVILGPAVAAVVKVMSLLYADWPFASVEETLK